MGFYKNYLFFVIKGAVTVGILSSLGYTLLQYLISDNYLSVMMSVYVATFGAILGLVSASAAFWILYPFRRRKNISAITYGVGAALMIVSIMVFFGYDIKTTELNWWLLFFPILPSVISLLFFRQFVRSNVESIR